MKVTDAEALALKAMYRNVSSANKHVKTKFINEATLGTHVHVSEEEDRAQNRSLEALQVSLHFFDLLQ